MSITRKEICRLLQEQGGRSEVEADIVAYVILKSGGPHVRRSELLKVSASMRVEYCLPSSRGTRIYCAIQSPFTLEWYLFVRDKEAPRFPDRHHYTSRERPVELSA